MNQPNDDNDDDATIASAYQAGNSLRAIATANDTNPENIRRTLIKLGVQLRTPGRPPPSTPQLAPTGWFNPHALRSRREQLKLSRPDLAKSAGISPRSLERLENPTNHAAKQRHVRPSVATLHALAAALDTDAARLMKGTKNLRWSRIAAGIDADDFATQLGIATRKLSDIERGKQQLPEHLHERAAELLNITPQTLARRLRY